MKNILLTIAAVFISFNVFSQEVFQLGGGINKSFSGADTTVFYKVRNNGTALVAYMLVQNGDTTLLKANGDTLALTKPDTADPFFLLNEGDILNRGDYYYWDGDSWEVYGGGTLDQSYDFGGAGAGREIVADNGAVWVSGEDGFIVDGVFESGDTIGIDGVNEFCGMYFNPRKAAFRAGYVDGDSWDNINVGKYSFAIGQNSIASGFESIALGGHSISTGNNSFSTGNFTTSKSYSETVIGLNNTDYTPTSTSVWEATDRLFVVGNGDGVNPNSDALVILKNGNTGLGTSTPDTTLHVVGQIKYVDGNQGEYKYLTSDANGNASWVDPNATESFAATNGGSGTPATTTNTAVLAPVATIATYTLNFPASPRNGQVFRIVSNGQTITALTLATTAVGGIIGGITALTGAGATYVYISSIDAWCRS